MKYPTKDKDSTFYFFANKPFVFAESGEALLSDQLYYTQWSLIRSLRDLPSRREIKDDMSFVFVKNREQLIYRPTKEPFFLPEIDDVFPDEGNRWFSLYLETSDDGLSPRRKSKKVDRLQLLNLWLKCRCKHVRFLLGDSYEA